MAEVTLPYNPAINSASVYRVLKECYPKCTVTAMGPGGVSVRSNFFKTTIVSVIHLPEKQLSNINIKKGVTRRVLWLCMLPWLLVSMLRLLDLIDKGGLLYLFLCLFCLFFVPLYFVFYGMAKAGNRDLEMTELLCKAFENNPPSNSAQSAPTSNIPHKTH